MDKYTIGRSSQNDIVICDRTDRVSRFHAELLVNSDGTYTLIDKSTHGSTVNGQPLHCATRQVKYGDRIMFADTAQFDWSSIEHNFIGPDPNPVPEKEMAPCAVPAMVFGILALVAYIGAYVFGVVGLILSAVGLGRTRNNRDHYKCVGMLRAGLICSIVAIVVYSIVFLIIYFTAVSLSY